MKTEAVNVRRVGAQMNAVAQKLKSADRTKEISKSVKRSMPIIQKGLKEMDKMGLDKVMAEFDTVMEDLDVKADTMNNGLNGVYSSSIDQTQVDQLMENLKDSQAAEMNSTSTRISYYRWRTRKRRSNRTERERR